MKTLSRRSLLSMSLVGLSGAALSGCVTTRDGTKVTHTLDVTKIQNYMTAGLRASAMLATVFTLIPATKKYAVQLKNATAFLTTAAAAFTDKFGNKLSVNYDETDARTVIDAVFFALKGLMAVAHDILDAATNEPDISTKTKDALTGVELVVDALATVIAVFQMAIAPSLVAAPKMSEQRALQILSA